jgi:purine-binding chemotaxis protein CheW
MEEMYLYPWVIFSLKSERYAVPTTHVQTMVAMPDVVKLPKAPAHVRGVINLRGQTSPLIDLRLRLGMDSSLETINNQIAMLKQREQDHRNWLQELELSVHEGRKFTLATDCHKCKFGQWFDSYRPKSFTEGQFLKKFEQPHQRIHQIAIRVEELLDQGHRDQALALINKTHDRELAEMILLFQQFAEMTRKQANQEIALVLETKGNRTAIAVDTIMTVEKILHDTIEPMPEVAMGTSTPLAKFIAKSGKDRSLVYLLEADGLVAEGHS